MQLLVQRLCEHDISHLAVERSAELLMAAATDTKAGKSSVALYSLNPTQREMFGFVGGLPLPYGPASKPQHKGTAPEGLHSATQVCARVLSVRRVERSPVWCIATCSGHKVQSAHDYGAATTSLARGLAACGTLGSSWLW